MPTEQSTIRSLTGVQRPLMIAPPSIVAHELKGAVYTKRWVVEVLLDLAGYDRDVNLVDAVAVEPAAGQGAFLDSMIERLVASSRRLNRPLSDCEGSLVAYELDIASAARAREVATGKLLGLGAEQATAEHLAAAWIRTGDYLFDAAAIEADFVIGNPPYVRLEDIPAETAMSYRNAYSTMRGRADLYVAFFEAALRQLVAGGVCAFICADRWMRNQFGAELRQLISADYAVEFVIEMHDADAFHDEVDAYPAITVIRRKTQGTAVVAVADAAAGFAGAAAVSSALRASGRLETMTRVGGLRASRVESWFEGPDPWPCRPPEHLALLRRLEAEFPKLEGHARVGIGVATGNDAVFITRDANLVEQSRLLKLALVKDILGGKLQWSGHFLVDPWDADGLVDLDAFPLARAYFEKHGPALRKRHTALHNSRGWYKTIDRVTHTLTSKSKIYIPDIKNCLTPVLDRGETYPHHNLYFIQSDAWDLEVLGGLLMSAIGQFFVESYGVRMRGGYWRFQAQYLRRIRVPDPRTIAPADAKELAQAFRNRDKHRATELAFNIYGIAGSELRMVLGH